MQNTRQILEEMYTGDPDRIVPNCVITVDGQEVLLHPAIAQMRNTVLANRQREREHYCDAHNIDGARWRGCHRCDDTGVDRFNRLACFCDMGRVESLKQQAAELRETDRLREVASRPRVVEVAA